MKFGSPEAIRFTKGIVLTAIFIGLVCLPSVDSAFKLDHAPIPNEKRLLAPVPAWTGVAGLRDFTTHLNQFFDDHFGFRRRLIRANNHWKRQLFQTPALDILLGRDGWLFTTSNGMLDQYLGFSRFSQNDLEAWQQLLEKRQKWLAARGCKYLFVVAPDKQNVYPEYFPEIFARSPKPGKIAQLVQHMKAHSSLPVLDLTDSLVQGKECGAPLYLKTDTHWNNLGAFVAYQAVMAALSNEVADLKPLPLAAFDRKPLIRPMGDLGPILGDTGGMETQHVAFVATAPLANLEIKVVPERLPKQWVKETDPKLTKNESQQNKAIMFHDSFGSAWEPFLGYHFNEVLYIWQYYFDSAFLEREKPQVVISEFVERIFNQENPRELLLKDGL
jgi:hypothetical protein